MQNGRKVTWCIVGVCVALLIVSANFDKNSFHKKTEAVDLFEKNCLENTSNAETFLSQIAVKPNVRALIPGKLYYEVLKEGRGPQVLPFSTSLFHYILTTVNGNKISDTYEKGAPKSVCLANAILGFAKGVEGMNAGEKRKLYIHPDLAYRKIGLVVPPQMLLIIEVEAIDDSSERH